MAGVRIPDDGGDIVYGIDVGSFVHPSFGKSASEVLAIYESVQSFRCRDDDILLCTFFKTGTNWLYEVLMMLISKSADRVLNSKMDTMLEFACLVDNSASPRILNSHYSPKCLAKDWKKRKLKTVLCIRNPKDTAVSTYNHMRQIHCFEYKGDWKNFIHPYNEGKFVYGHYADYLNEWQQFMEDNPDFPLHVVYFEDLKKCQTGIEVVKLAEFLDIKVDTKLVEDIVHACGFEKMKVEKKTPKELLARADPNFTFFRKGEVGDWKNWFTVAQNEMFDKLWNKRICQASIFKFQYN